MCLVIERGLDYPDLLVELGSRALPLELYSCCFRVTFVARLRGGAALEKMVAKRSKISLRPTREQADAGIGVH